MLSYADKAKCNNDVKTAGIQVGSYRGRVIIPPFEVKNSRSLSRIICILYVGNIRV